MGTLKVNGAISATGTISATNGFAGNLDWSYITNAPNFALKRNNNGFYVGLGSCYTAGTHPTYYRITLPDVQLNVYGMYTIDILVNQSYSGGYGGKIIIEAYHGASEMVWYSFKAHVSGTLTSDIKVYGSDGKYFYIGGCSAWGNIAIENMIVADTAWYNDLSGTTVDYVNSLPSTYQTAEMHYGLTSQNYSSYCAPASHTHRYLPLDGGGTMTGSISYQTANYTSTPLYVLDDGTSYGHTLIVGAGGSTFIGGGESAADLYNATGWKSAENIYLAATEIEVFTNCDDVSNRVQALRIDTSGNLIGANWTLYSEGSFTGNSAGADTVDGYHASSLFKIGPWWYSGNSHNANDLVNSTVFAYTSHNVPYVGTLIDFSNSENANYRFQINAAYNNENVAFRSRNGDNGTWREWTSFITSANYTSYCAPASHSHSYASLASPNNLMHSGNEFTFVPEGYSGSVWFNYRAGWNTNGNISEYHFGNGRGGLAPAVAQYFRTANYGSGVPGTSTPGYGNTGAIYYKV